MKSTVFLNMTYCCLTEFTDVPKEHTASIFMAKESSRQILLNIMKAVCSSEIPINFYHTIWHTSQKTVFSRGTAKRNYHTSDSIIYLWLYSHLLGLGRCFFSFLIFYMIGSTPWTGDQPIARLLCLHRTAQHSSYLRQHRHCDWALTSLHSTY
jgi:hypothetical protein